MQLASRRVLLRGARRCASSVSKDIDVESLGSAELRTLAKQQRAHIQLLSDELVKVNRNVAYRTSLGQEDIDEVMKQRLQQILAVLGVCTVLMIWYTSRQNRMLLTGLETVSSSVKGKMAALKDEVKELETAWAQEMERKEKQLQQMSQQSSEQTRSIDRLTIAIRSIDNAQ
eukprot:TRINITY_DN1746_c0_g2_i1.p1 TRINITY_DN1746_c0_g2~~TRINITY_DN1746_c0_g2_i1.p1  ORF type:complete len:172 (+),score=41.85 TRINITY_DN1746_c0_g2_i1:69-584(+)